MDPYEGKTYTTEEIEALLDSVGVDGYTGKAMIDAKIAAKHNKELFASVKKRAQELKRRRRKKEKNRKKRK